MDTGTGGLGGVARQAITCGPRAAGAAAFYRGLFRCARSLAALRDL